MIRTLIKENIVELNNRIHELSGMPGTRVVCVWSGNLLTVGMKDNQPYITSGVIAQTFDRPMAAWLCKTVRNGHGDYPITMAEIDYCRLRKADLAGLLRELISVQ